MRECPSFTHQKTIREVEPVGYNFEPKERSVFPPTASKSMKDNPLYALIGLATLMAVGMIGWRYDPAEVQLRIDRIVERAESAERAEMNDSVVAKGSDSMTLFQQALDLDPDNVPLLARLGMKHFLRREYAESAKCWSHAVSLDPNNADLRNDVAIALGKLEKYDQGIEHLEEALRLSPETLRFANNLASLYVDDGQDAEAERTLRNAHKKPAVVHFNLAHLYVKRDRLDEAKRQVEIALAADPDLGRALRLQEELAAKMR